MDAPPEGMTDGEKARTLPDPAGYKLLCTIPDLSETFEGTNIIRPESIARDEALTTTVLFVMKAGPEAYKDAKKFPNGPWCKEGDFVLVRMYAGTRFKVFGQEFRLINDDQVEAVVQDPRGVSKVQ
jgi:co-chaperonin GroES (HSP10)